LGNVNIVLFSKQEIDEPLSLDDARALHICSVLRKGEGDFFEAGIASGKAGRALITKIDEKQKKLYFSFEPLSDGKPLHAVTMIIGFPRPIQLKRIFRDMASLGAEAIHLTGTELGEKSYMQSKMFERGTAESLLRDGSAQAKSTYASALFLHQTLDECLQSVSSEQKAVRAALDNALPQTTLVEFLRESIAHNNHAQEQTPVIAAVGSERGWTDVERESLKRAGFTLCGIGERVLRTETACTVSLSLILAALGAL
jgi:RsmE family RNA methyltransferase